MGDGHNVKQSLITDFEEKTIPESYDEFIFEDIFRHQSNPNWSLEDHSQYVQATWGETYHGVNKYLYSNALVAIDTIVKSVKEHKRNPLKKREAISYLHQDLMMSPNMIQRILNLFNVKLGTRNILRLSEEGFSDKPLPQWVENFYYQRRGL